MIRVLGIETSCDETGAAVVEDGCRVVVNLVASQVPLHAKYGGVVPEIASRRHTEVIYPMIAEALDRVGGAVDVVAATSGPGLMGSLLVGVNFGKALAYARRLPFVPVHHIEGHLFSAFLEGTPPEFPFLALIVSGGHTQLFLCRAAHDYVLLGSTRDDAVGEAFDKVARLLGLPYPGGPSIQKEAESGDTAAYDFPRAMAHGDSLEFSYSGLKTAVLYEVKRNPGARRADVAASFQEAAVDALLVKTKTALRETRAPRLVVAGGVAANKRLRARLQQEIDVPVLLPRMEFCVDNAAMIAAAGHWRFVHGYKGTLRTTPDPDLRLV